MVSIGVLPMPDNVPAVAEPASVLMLKYCCSRNRATQALFPTLLVAGWDGGRRRRPEPATAMLWDAGFSTAGRTVDTVLNSYGSRPKTACTSLTGEPDDPEGQQQTPILFAKDPPLPAGLFRNLRAGNWLCNLLASCLVETLVWDSHIWRSRLC